MAGEDASCRRHLDSRGTQLWIQAVDLGRRHHMQLAGNRTECRIAPDILAEMLEPDRAETQREADQIWEAQLCAGELVPARMGVLGGDPIGIDVDACDLVRRNVLLVAQSHQRLDGGLKMAAACVRLDVAVGDAECDGWRQSNRPRLVDAPERERLQETVARLNYARRSLHALLGQQCGLNAFARGVPGMQALDV